MPYIISIANNKGGCGKTTVTTSLADALGKRNLRVLVIDMDPQSNTTKRLCPRSTTLRRTLYDFFEIFEKNDTSQPVNIQDLIYPTELNNVDFVPNVGITAILEPAISDKREKSLYYLRERFRDYSLTNYDITLIDNPPNMGTFVLLSLYASDFVLVPVKAGSADSVEGLIKATDKIKEIRDGGKSPDLKFLRIIINSMDKRTNICNALVTQIKKHFADDQLIKTVIPVNTAFEQAESRGATIFQEDGASSGARAFRKIAQELIDILQ